MSHITVFNNIILKFENLVILGYYIVMVMVGLGYLFGVIENDLPVKSVDPRSPRVSAAGPSTQATAHFGWK